MFLCCIVSSTFHSDRNDTSLSNAHLQDTVIALQALAEYAALTSGNNAGQNLAIAVNADSLTHRFTINAANALVLQSVQVMSVGHFSIIYTQLRHSFMTFISSLLWQ